jgi:hypothetical protein
VASKLIPLALVEACQRLPGPGVGWPVDRNTTHWLENGGTIPAVEISVDIVSQE